jgi:hypothetical protein
MDASLATPLLPGMACMQKMQKLFSVQNGLIFGEPQAAQLGCVIPDIQSSTLRASRAVQNCSRQFCFFASFFGQARPPGMAEVLGMQELFSVKSDSHAYSLIDAKQGQHPHVKQLIRSAKSLPNPYYDAMINSVIT